MGPGDLALGGLQRPLGLVERGEHVLLAGPLMASGDGREPAFEVGKRAEDGGEFGGIAAHDRRVWQPAPPAARAGARLHGVTGAAGSAR